MKLSIGTVQFGIPYGINNSRGVPDDEEIKKLFVLAWSAGIDTLDTAPAYGNAEQKISELAEAPFKIISKFAKTDSAASLSKSLNDSLTGLVKDSIYGYLAHNADNLLERPELWDTLNKMKASNKVSKIGYSLYTEEQLEKLLQQDFIADLVQIPYSLLDRKFESYLPQLKDAGTEVHVRSVFLQGLYFMDTDNLPEKLATVKPALQTLHTICKSYNIPIGSIALNFAMENEYIDKVIVGVDTLQQLQQNINMVTDWQPQSKVIALVKKINIADKKLLNPANW